MRFEKMKNKNQEEKDSVEVRKLLDEEKFYSNLNQFLEKRRNISNRSLMFLTFFLTIPRLGAFLWIAYWFGKAYLYMKDEDYTKNYVEVEELDE